VRPRRHQALLCGPSTSPLAVMRKRVCLLTAIVLLGAGTSGNAGDLDARRHYWEERLGRDLPAGSELSAVQKYFAAARLEQHYYSKSNTLYALERNVSHSLVVSCDVTIDCTFDAQKLQKCVVGKVCTGP
jgi:hypothetical protein